jgi:hypothetical protein
MRRTYWMLVPALALAAAACGRNSSPVADDALKNDLALASQAQPANGSQTISPAEAGYASQQKLAAAPAVARRAPAGVRRTAARRSSGVSRSRSGGGTGGYYPAPVAPPEVIVKHTERDAAIGAAAGAVIGATTSRNKVKGGLIGAAVGGILGGVIGNNVDKQKKVGW